jgi:predicted membrane protein
MGNMGVNTVVRMFTRFALVGSILGATLADALGSAVPPGLTRSIPTSVPQGLGTAAIVGGILALLAPFIGGAWGAKTGSNRP